MHVNMAGETKSLTYCGDWRLDREIGRGAYGVVYIAANGKGERAAERARIGGKHREKFNQIVLNQMVEFLVVLGDDDVV